MRSPFLSVAGFTVDVFVGPVACDDRVERFAAVVTLVALSVPFAALREHLLGGEHDAAATWTTFAGRGFDYGGVDHGCTRSGLAKNSEIFRIRMIRNFRRGRNLLIDTIESRERINLKCFFFKFLLEGRKKYKNELLFFFFFPSREIWIRWNSNLFPIRATRAVRSFSGIRKTTPCKMEPVDIDQRLKFRGVKRLSRGLNLINIVVVHEIYLKEILFIFFFLFF